MIIADFPISRIVKIPDLTQLGCYMLLLCMNEFEYIPVESISTTASKVRIGMHQILTNLTLVHRARTICFSCDLILCV